MAVAQQRATVRPGHAAKPTSRRPPTPTQPSVESRVQRKSGPAAPAARGGIEEIVEADLSEDPRFEP